MNPTIFFTNRPFFLQILIDLFTTKYHKIIATILRMKNEPTKMFNCDLFATKQQLLLIFYDDIY